MKNVTTNAARARPWRYRGIPGGGQGVRSSANRAGSLALLIAIATVPLVIGKVLAGEAPTRPATAPSDAALDSKTRREVAESLAKALTDDYAHADIGKKMAEAIRARLKAKAYDGMTSREEFARALQADARSVANDKHLRVNPDAGSMPLGPPSATVQEQIRKQNGAIRRVQILPGNIGYMEVNGVPPAELAKDAIAAAFAFLHNTDALILDARGNGGGDPNTVALYMSYLSDEAPYIVNAIHDRDGEVERTKTTDLGALSYGSKKPVFCLTSGLTFSGGEELAYDIQSFKRGLIVGGVTGGGANPTAPHALAHGFVAAIPFGYVVHPATGTNWEGVGIKPDVAIAPELALVEAQRLAVERLKADASDPADRAALQTLSLELQRQGKSGVAAEANSNRLTPRQLIGPYTPVAGRAPPEVTESAGSLFMRHPASGELLRLIPLGNDRYRLEGMPEDFTVAFSEQDGKVLLVARMADRPPAVAQKK